MTKRARSVRDFMTPNPYCVWTTDTLQTAREAMRRHGVRHLPVLDENRPAGLVSERDLIAIERFHDVDPAKVEVHEAMAPLPYCVRPDEPLDTVLQAMAQNQYGS